VIGRELTKAIATNIVIPIMPSQTFMIVGLFLLVATLALNRFLSERNFRSLNQEEKLKLMDEFSKQRSLATYIPIAVMMIVSAISYQLPDLFLYAFPVGIGVVLMVALAIQVSILRRLATLSLPTDYVQKFRLQSILVQLGNTIALAMMGYAIIIGSR